MDGGDLIPVEMVNSRTTHDGRERPMMDLPKPDCAVVIPAFNAAKYLKETLESVLLIREISTEIILVDDGSTDETQQIVAMMAGQRNIRYIRQANAGVSAARNVGFALTVSDYVCFLDADDCFTPGGLETMYRRITGYPDAVGVYGGVLYFDGNSRAADFSSKYRSDEPAVTKLDSIIQGHLIDTTGAVLFRRSKLTTSGLFDESIRIGEDWELYVRISRLGNFHAVNRPVLKYRVHDRSAMHTQAGRLQDHEPAIAKVFDPSINYSGIGPKTLNLYRLRKIAGIMRLLVLRSRGFATQVSNLSGLSTVCIRSRFDGPILKMTLKSLLSASKRLVP
jgi:glycosyltransferase involved in cell wall biosynthesis